jgi:hypothetical protein
MTWLFLLKKKSETFSFFQVFKELTENEIDMKESLCQNNLTIIVMKMELKYIYLLYKHLSKMVLLKEKTELLWKWQNNVK